MSKRSNPQPRRWQSLLSGLCMVLVFLAGTLSVTHSHEHSLDDHGACSLCVSAHAVAQVATAPAQVTIAQVFQSLVPPATLTRAHTFLHADLYTRPPPARAPRA